ncbi:MAG: hypothetical protein LUD48_02640, partial [Prevotella sp.]|nr:hypothetical protein [Prevotella sp.]
MKRSNIRKYRKLLKLSRWLRARFNWLFVSLAWLKRKLRWMKYLNPFRYLKILDWYIIRKFIGTYFYSIILIISISIVFDVNENLAKFAQYHA